MSHVYYNEIDPFCAAWLRELMKAGEIPEGEVDERDIRTVQPEDVRGSTACHFFAGIGGWAYALRLAGWPSDRPVWTGSCPCQPFSAAGRNDGGNDPRHLWPAWFRLIRKCHPDCVLGEQVEAAIAHGWLDLICDDLEREGYAVGACCLPACSVGAPHIRQRLWFVADSVRAAGERRTRGVPRTEAAISSARESDGRVADRFTDSGETDGMGHASGERLAGRAGQRRDDDEERATTERASNDAGGLELSESLGGQVRQAERAGSGRPPSAGLPSKLDNSLHSVSPRRKSSEFATAHREGQTNRPNPPSATGELGHAKSEQVGRARLAWQDFWRDCDWLPCRDGKARPVEPGTFPLAHRIPSRMGRLRGYGNAIVPQVAAEFIEAYLSL